MINRASKGADRRRSAAKTETANVIANLVVAAGNLIQIGIVRLKPNPVAPPIPRSTENHAVPTPLS